jgi:acyl-CoA synthetase (NDP forming)
MARKQLDKLVNIKNPLDINPGADDEVHVETVRLLAEDSHVDAVVVGLDPLSPAMRTLSECKAGRYDFNDPSSIAMTLPALLRGLRKPVVGVVDAGQLYDPLVDALMEKDVPVFRSSDRAVRALALYLEGRVAAERLRTGSS